jgi:adenine-specific DNA-methyltransferase
LSFALIKDERQLQDRRKLGAFYTPAALSQVIADWAIKSSQDSVLEPSFGGCGFLQAARDRLLALGSRVPRDLIYGCDIDPVAFDYLFQSLGAPVDLVRFVKGDFLDVVSPSGWPDKFSSILANPPYIPYQQIGAEKRAELMKRKWAVEGAAGRSSLWAYFLLHALPFLKRGGRMAWVLPGAFLQADYAKPIRAYLSDSFARSAVFILRERVFLDEGADEETVVLLADGHREQPKTAGLVLGAVASIEELRATLSAWDAGEWSGATARRPANLDLTGQASVLFEKYASASVCKHFGTVATVQVGLVTGANEFFVLDDVSRKGAGLEKADCCAILSKFQAAKGLRFTRSDHDATVRGGGRALLVAADDNRENSRLDAYFATFDPERRQTISTFKKRRVWTQPNDNKIPDAFLPVMHHTGPRLVLNPDQITCTNTIHRVYFDSTYEVSQFLIAISLLTSFSQLSAELVGRRYGSGVLKHEPREAEKIELLLPSLSDNDVASVFDAVDTALRSGDSEGATRLADALIFPAVSDVDWRVASNGLCEALKTIRQHRRPDRSNRRRN